MMPARMAVFLSLAIATTPTFPSLLYFPDWNHYKSLHGSWRFLSCVFRRTQMGGARFQLQRQALYRSWLRPAMPAKAIEGR
jgi:hypothetical protein